MHRPQISAILLSVLLAPGSSLAASSLDCSKIIVDGQNFDFSELSGPHSVVTSRWEPNPPAHFNTTYTLDICNILTKDGGNKEDRCPSGTRVCAIQHHLKGDQDTVMEVISIAGALENAGGTAFDFEATRLKTSDSTSDSQKEGVRLILKGGKHPLSGHDKREQKAIIEFLCDKDRNGLEGEWESEDKYKKPSKRDEEKKDEEKEGGKEKEGDKEGDKKEEESTIEHQLKHNNTALIWDSYKDEKGIDVLRLTWHTKHACEKRDGGDDGKDGDEKKDPSAGWGFFTWFIIIVFLGIASYLIFGSWLNYNRYGARGWDLLPHGDTIRDIPYLMKDWLRRVLNSVQGSGSRGGYSAV